MSHLDQCLEDLADGDREKRLEAIRKLASLGDPRAREPLQRSLIHLDPQIRTAAAEALASLGEPGWKRLLQGDELDLMRIARVREPWTAVELIRVVEEGSGKLRAAAAEALGFLYDEAAVEPLCKALEDPDPAVRDTAAAALPRNTDSYSIWSVVQVLLDGSSDARRAAAHALGRTNEPLAAGPLTRALEDDDGDVRRAAAGALGRLLAEADPSAVPERVLAKLIAVLETADPAVVEALAGPLETMGERLRETGLLTVAVQALVALVGSRSGRVRRASAGVLAAWYRSDLLDDAAREIVLSLRQRLEKPHVDRVTSEDYERREPGRGWFHVDYPFHQDHGIGVSLEAEPPPPRRRG